MQEEADDEAGEDDDEDAEVCMLESGATAYGFLWATYLPRTNVLS